MLAIIGCALLIFVGVQPPNEKVGYLIVGLILGQLVVWFVPGRRGFEGPPIGERIAARQAEIAAAERAVGEAAE